MKVILYMTISANGYIARENGDEDFLSDKNWETSCALAKRCGCFVIGRKTYEAIQEMGQECKFNDLKDVVKVVVSNSNILIADNNYILADSPSDAINKLKAKGLKEMMVTGGATINSAFMRAGLIDEIILNVEPFILGKGISLFSKEEFDCPLNLVGIKEVGEGIVQLHYEVKK
jgi:dihydrofolate reductase